MRCGFVSFLHRLWGSCCLWFQLFRGLRVGLCFFWGLVLKTVKGGSFRRDSRGCVNLNCPVRLRSVCDRAVSPGSGGVACFTPTRVGCDMFSRKAGAVL